MYGSVLDSFLHEQNNSKSILLSKFVACQISLEKTAWNEDQKYSLWHLASRLQEFCLASLIHFI